MSTFYKTELCRNWQQKGTCPYGTKCQFAHGDIELQKVKPFYYPPPPPPPLPMNKFNVRYEKSALYKTEICRNWQETGTCRYGSICQFAHGENELQRFKPYFIHKINNLQVEKSALYKTEICRNWKEKGTCRYGTKCQFAHGENELVQTHLVQNQVQTLVKHDNNIQTNIQANMQTTMQTTMQPTMQPNIQTN
ncbi:10403_t:CDS:2 [Ambispora gerdemannii]|uniref:10403_t:CDS:1 n=1 Tax=Ambispora gerdemannii TaxID=144530 RepID=A0A9N9CMN8_9GLOM|nr:10403_t:CDS:2 [Ambispora gerdemannii]